MQNLYFWISSGDFLGTNITGAIHGHSQLVIIPQPVSPLAGVSSPLNRKGAPSPNLTTSLAVLCSTPVLTLQNLMIPLVP
jgi:hypothetical protein